MGHIVKGRKGVWFEREGGRGGTCLMIMSSSNGSGVIRTGR